MKGMNIYLTGVGGQGIGMLSEVILRGADHAGLSVKGVDTHGLAQRGGIVISQIRTGSAAHSPLIPAGRAHMVIALERHEALRGAAAMLMEGGTLAYYNTSWQPLPVRLGTAPEVTEEDITALCKKMNAREIKIFSPELADPVMQNVVILGRLAGMKLIPGMGPEHYRMAMGDIMEGGRLEKNLELFERELKKI